MLTRTIAICTFFAILPFVVAAQPERGDKEAGPSDNLALSFTLSDCIAYALKHQPAVNQSRIDESISGENRSIALSNWLPQANVNAFYQHYYMLPTAFLRVNGVVTPISSGALYGSTPQLSVTQNIFSNDALLAAKVAQLYTRTAKENLETAKIAVVVDVSRAFYEVLLSTERIAVFREDTARLIKNQKDAYHRFESGITDKVDYKQATISLNNAMARLKTADEGLHGKYATLKQLMGCSPDRALQVKFDTAQMIQGVATDTLAVLHIEKRTEYKTLQLIKNIQRETVRYYKFGFLPTLSAFYTYNLQFQSNTGSDLYTKSYPNSLAGLQLNVPVFSGLKRTHNIHKAKLQEKRVDWDDINLKLAINSEYQAALAAYKSNLYSMRSLSENKAMAREVYNIVKLQYTEGIKTYLDVIVAETDLQTSEINYLDALFQVLQSKLQLEKAMGDIAVD